MRDKTLLLLIKRILDSLKNGNYTPDSFESEVLSLKDEKQNNHKTVRIDTPHNYSDTEIIFLLERAECYEKEGNHSEAIKCYGEIIAKLPDNSPYKPHTYITRAHLFSSLSRWKEAIEDSKMALKLNPDSTGGYLNVGAYLSMDLFYSGKFEFNKYNELFEESIAYYKACLERNPQSITAWLNIVETNMFMCRWDEAISYYGSCKPYIDTLEHQVIRAWLGSMAIVLAGDPLELED